MTTINQKTKQYNNIWGGASPTIPPVRGVSAWNLHTTKVQQVTWIARIRTLEQQLKDAKDEAAIQEAAKDAALVALASEVQHVIEWAADAEKAEQRAINENIALQAVRYKFQIDGDMFDAAVQEYATTGEQERSDAIKALYSRRTGAGAGAGVMQ